MNKHLMFTQAIEASRINNERILDPTIRKALHLGIDDVIIQYITLMIENMEWEELTEQEANDFRSWYQNQLTKYK